MNHFVFIGEFIAFETTLNLPDSMFRVAFQLFDQNGSGTISVHNFKELMERVDRSSDDFPIPPFNFDSEYVKLFFGSDLKHELNYDEFTEFIQGYLQAYSVQAFWSHRKLRNGFVTPDGTCCAIARNCDVIIHAHLFAQSSLIFYDFYDQL